MRRVRRLWYWFRRRFLRYVNCMECGEGFYAPYWMGLPWCMSCRTVHIRIPRE